MSNVTKLDILINDMIFITAIGFPPGSSGR